jgi:hypothetical protein
LFAPPGRFWLTPETNPNSVALNQTASGNTRAVVESWITVKLRSLGSGSFSIRLCLRAGQNGEQFIMSNEARDLIELILVIFCESGHPQNISLAIHSEFA